MTLVFLHLLDPMCYGYQDNSEGVSLCSSVIIVTNAWTTADSTSASGRRLGKFLRQSINVHSVVHALSNGTLFRVCRGRGGMLEDNSSLTCNSGV
jgi:hypothetical protein